MLWEEISNGAIVEESMIVEGDEDDGAASPAEALIAFDGAVDRKTSWTNARSYCSSRNSLLFVRVRLRLCCQLDRILLFIFIRQRRNPRCFSSFAHFFLNPGL